MVNFRADLFLLSLNRTRVVALKESTLQLAFEECPAKW